MLELEEARSRLLSSVEPLDVERVPIRQAAFRVSARLVDAAIDLPAFDNSAMDGYAVRAADVAAAKIDSPVTLSLVGKIAAGQNPAGDVRVGECVRVFTGSVLPPGADAVVMQEDTAVSEAVPQVVRVLDPVKPWENVRFRGEDVKRGAVLVRAGERLSPGHAGLLSATGVASVEVFRQPVIGLIATGSELVEPGGTLLPGQIFESNRTLLEPLIARSGATARVYPLVPDTLAGTKDALSQAFAECDGVVTSGGVSVGELDFVKAAFEQLGGELDFWKVAIKPGKPFVFGKLGSKRLFGLPGNPVSAMVTFLLLVRPALWRWQGAPVSDPRTIPCKLGEPLVNQGGRRHFMRVSVDAKGVARSAGLQASHRLRSLAEANALVDVPPDAVLAAGAEVNAIWLD
ncbi:MAG: molybdopterin molybdotransferase MoeA [Verrucomicrobia bacterium]|nr:molybdopterin molybdotransferase MoeA [Verrucomicrobiota bacterium]